MEFLIPFGTIAVFYVFARIAAKLMDTPRTTDDYLRRSHPYREHLSYRGE